MSRADLAVRLERALQLPVEWHASLPSTNERARELGRRSAADGSIVVADEQTAGRGRRGRTWFSPAGAGLYASILVSRGRWLRQPALAQLAAGVAVAEAVITRAGVSAELVWPNDCYVQGRKLAGVLVEAEVINGGLLFLVCGIGVNVDFGDSPPEEPLASTAIDLASVARAEVDRVTLAGELFDRLLRLRAESEVDGGRGILERWRRLAPMAEGTLVAVDTPTGREQGTTAGLAEDGALMLLVNGEPRRLMVGEVVRLRRQA